MTQYPSEPVANYGTPQPAKKGWFGRNWLWFVPTIILVPIFCCCGGGGLLTWYAFNKIMELPAYVDGVAIAQQNADVQKALGSPITAPSGFMEFVEMIQQGGQFDVQNYGSTIELNAQAPLSGPGGTATLTIEAESSDNGATWNYNALFVEIDSTGERIELISTNGTDTDSPETN